MNTDVELVRFRTAEMTTGIVSSFVSSNPTAIADVQKLIADVHASIAALFSPAEPEAPKQEPAVAIRASLKPDYLVCLEDGKKLKMLKRYLRTNYGMSPEDYRAKWGLPRDYPMVAPEYAEQRKQIARENGLGHAKR